MEIWYRTDRFKRAADNRITARVEFSGESPWFEGHFPQEPILPGIAQLAVVHDLLCKALEENLPVREVSRVRFKRKINPHDRLTVTVTLSDNLKDPHKFRLTCGDDLVCNGFLRVRDNIKEKE